MGSESAAYLPLVLRAAAAIRPHVTRTPLVPSPFLSESFGFPVHLKLENLQVTAAFKIRGAMNKVLALQGDGVGRVVAASSGSHAMGVALAARTCGLAATIVMPESSPEFKRRKVRAYGAELVIRGRDFEEARLVAAETARLTGAVMVSGIDDELVFAGHGTMALEILQDLPEADFVAIPVGGGGAIAGLLMALKSRPEGAIASAARAPGVQVWGVQSSGAPSMIVSLERGEPVELPEIKTIADAIAVRRPGGRAFALVKELADGVVAVDDDLLLETVGRLALEAKIVAEPASAAPLAVDWRNVLDAHGRPLPQAAVFVVTGGNIPSELLRRAIEAAG